MYYGKWTEYFHELTDLLTAAYENVVLIRILSLVSSINANDLVLCFDPSSPLVSRNGKNSPFKLTKLLKLRNWCVQFKFVIAEVYNLLVRNQMLIENSLSNDVNVTVDEGSVELDV